MTGFILISPTIPSSLTKPDIDMANGVQIEPPFSQGVGYGIVVGLGAAFAIGMSMVSLFLSKYFEEKQDSEMFMTAKHSVKTGLTASAVVSSWTIAATLLSSTSCKLLIQSITFGTFLEFSI